MGTNALLLVSALFWLAHLLLVIGLTVRVIMRRPPTGVALAWLVLIALAPLAGAALYLLIGERRIGRGRTRGLTALRNDYQRYVGGADQADVTRIDWSRHPASHRRLEQLGRSVTGLPALAGSRFQLFSETHLTLEQIIRDIDSAQQSLLMEFYIWNSGGQADEVLQAMIRAAQRGVACYVLIDGLGARPWWQSDQPRMLRSAGVQLRPALPVSLLRTLVGRNDLRLHRKILVVDGQLAWTGSMNLVDPRFFKQDSGVGQWVDAMVRLEGPVAAPLALTMIGDWILETHGDLQEMVRRSGVRLGPPCGSTTLQVVPSGPGESGDAQLQMIIALIHSAEQQIIMTTPYFVPDEALLFAVRGAAARGVRVRLIVPERVDSVMTRYASRSYLDELMRSSVEVYLYRGGLLHTKSISIDGHTAMFGTVNLDMRSIWLNYEVALYIYDQPFVAELVRLQLSYQADSLRLDPGLESTAPPPTVPGKHIAAGQSTVTAVRVRLVAQVRRLAI